MDNNEIGYQRYANHEYPEEFGSQSHYGASGQPDPQEGHFLQDVVPVDVGLENGIGLGPDVGGIDVDVDQIQQEGSVAAAAAAAEMQVAAENQQQLMTRGGEEFGNPSGAFFNVGQGLVGKYKNLMMQYWQDTINAIERDEHDFKNHQLPLARIKKVMKTDEEVKMISAEAPILFAKGCDIFITELTMRAWIHAEENKRRTLQKSDIAAALQKSDMFDFLIDIVPREEEKPKKKHVHHQRQQKSESPEQMIEHQVQPQGQTNHTEIQQAPGHQQIQQLQKQSNAQQQLQPQQSAQESSQGAQEQRSQRQDEEGYTQGVYNQPYLDPYAAQQQGQELIFQQTPQGQYVQYRREGKDDEKFMSGGYNF